MVACIPISKDRDGNAKSGILLHAVWPEPWYLHSRSKVMYQYNFSSFVETLHASMRYFQAQKVHRKSGMISAPPYFRTPPISLLRSDVWKSQLPRSMNGKSGLDVHVTSESKHKHLTHRILLKTHHGRTGHASSENIQR